MSRELGSLHESQRLGTQIGDILRPTTWSHAVKLYASIPAAIPVAGATDLLLELSRSSGNENGSPVPLIDIW